MNKNVLNKLSKIESKVELAEVRVDLALMDQLKKAETSFFDKSTAMVDAVTNIDKFVALAKSSLEISQKAFTEYQDLYLRVQKASKELGVDAPTDALYQKAKGVMLNNSMKISRFK